MAAIAAYGKLSISSDYCLSFLQVELLALAKQQSSQVTQQWILNGWFLVCNGNSILLREQRKANEAIYPASLATGNHYRY